MARLILSLREAVEAAKKKKAKLIIIQAPEGLKGKIIGIAGQIEKKTGAKTVVITKPCYGACDIPVNELKMTSADMVIHIGHTKMLETKNVFYLPLKYSVGKKTLERLSVRAAEKIRRAGFRKIGLVCTAQYLSHLSTVKKTLEKQGLKVYIGKSDFMAGGQVLGCNVQSASSIQGKTGCFLFIGDGQFHPLGVAIETKKPVFTLDPLNKRINRVSESESEKAMRAHLARIGIAKNAKNFGVMVSTKPGQFRLKEALELKELAEKNGKKATILLMDEVREDFVIGINVECLVNTACPRIVTDDAVNWEKPLVSAEEMRKALC